MTAVEDMCVRLTETAILRYCSAVNIMRPDFMINLCMTKGSIVGTKDQYYQVEWDDGAFGLHEGWELEECADYGQVH